MKIRCHLCGKITADIRDASIAKGAVMVCPECTPALEPYRALEKRGDMTDSMPRFMSDFFRGFGR